MEFNDDSRKQLGKVRDRYRYSRNQGVVCQRSTLVLAKLIQRCISHAWGGGRACRGSAMNSRSFTRILLGDSDLDATSATCCNMPGLQERSVRLRKRGVQAEGRLGWGTFELNRGLWGFTRRCNMLQLRSLQPSLKCLLFDILFFHLQQSSKACMRYARVDLENIWILLVTITQDFSLHYFCLFYHRLSLAIYDCVLLVQK